MGLWDRIQNQNITPTVKAAGIQAMVTITVFSLGLFWGMSNRIGRYQMFKGVSTVAISRDGVTTYEKEDNVFLIDTVTGKVRKYAHDSVTLGGKTTVFEGWNHILQPIGEDN